MKSVYVIFSTKELRERKPCSLLCGTPLGPKAALGGVIMRLDNAVCSQLEKTHSVEVCTVSIKYVVLAAVLCCYLIALPRVLFLPVMF